MHDSRPPGQGGLIERGNATRLMDPLSVLSPEAVALLRQHGLLQQLVRARC